MIAAGTLAAGSAVGAGLGGFLVVLALVVVCVLLFRSMNRRLRGVATKFPPQPDQPGAPSPPDAPTPPPGGPSARA